MRLRTFLGVVGAALGTTVVLAQQAPAPLAALVLPAGFQADVFADKVENARGMALGAQGTVFVGSMRAGKVHAVIDKDRDHKADRIVVIASGLDLPNGLAMRNGALYVATASKLLRFDDIESRLDDAADAGHAPRGPAEPERRTYLEVHRLRARRPALHVGRSTV